MQTLPAICSHVIYSRFEGSGAERKPVSYDTLVAGYERPAGHEVERDGLPMLTLIVPVPSQAAAFAGVNWADGLDRRGIPNPGAHMRPVRRRKLVIHSLASASSIAFFRS